MPAISAIGRSPSPELRKPNPCATNSALSSYHPPRVRVAREHDIPPTSLHFGHWKPGAPLALFSSSLPAANRREGGATIS
uniref:Uncharacterized protein n=1 Tax=Oryza glumipatula TaxID=40148 RepID=A0A0E0A854_9ORYZ